MKTSDFRNKPTSSQLKENMNKMFGVNVNLTKYSREQLEDMRNRLRTKVFQQEGKAGINDLLTNETYQKDKAMLALLNTRIKEMLGENLKQLKDKMIELSEAKKGVKAPKYKIHAKGTAGKDYDGDGKVETPKDEVWGSRAKAAAKSGKPFEEGKGSKPDFLDMDKDGNKKEPMKKAVADKKAGPKKGVNPFAKVKESAKPDFLDMDKDGDKKEPMKKAVADKKVKEAAGKCNHSPKGKSCPVHGLKECGGMYEGNKFDPLKHVEKKSQTPPIKQAAKDVDRKNYGDRTALMKAGGVKDDRGPRGVTQG